MKNEDVEIVVGRTEGGTFVRVAHVSTGRHRYQGPLDGEHPEITKTRLIRELFLELRDAGVDGYQDVESDCVVSVQIPTTVSAGQLSAIRRAHPSFQDLSLAELKQLLVRQSPNAILGPYLRRSVAADCCQHLCDVGLVAAVVSRTPR